MSRPFAGLCLASLLLGCASKPMEKDDGVYTPPTGTIVLRVEVLDVQFTDFYPGCGETEDCIPFYFWWRYHARVKEVVSGTWAQPVVDFTHLQHAEYIRKVTKDCYVVLHPAGDEIQSKVGVQFIAGKLLSHFFREDRSVIRTLRDGV